MSNKQIDDVLKKALKIAKERVSKEEVIKFKHTKPKLGENMCHGFGQDDRPIAKERVSKDDIILKEIFNRVTLEELELLDKGITQEKERASKEERDAVLLRITRRLDKLRKSLVDIQDNLDKIPVRRRQQAQVKAITRIDELVKLRSFIIGKKHLR